MVNLPLFHVGGTGAVYAMLAQGGSIAIVEAFDTDSVLATWCAETATTACILLGVMATFLREAAAGAAGPRPPAEAASSWCRLCEDVGSVFAERFGVDVHTVFNMTEIVDADRLGAQPAPLGTCGRPRAGVEARVVDENDCEVAPGEVGELIVRTDRPWAMNHGYYKQPRGDGARRGATAGSTPATPSASATRRATSSSSTA